ncbi:flavin reductase family protein [Rothia nasimurium]|uniref:flavin reductase family protein n=1 Tax=Rothia nasimurium TaxID=85336 RepID=UPI001F3C7044|nr:flavin reductase family protein [Rothia nasimurium]
MSTHIDITEKTATDLFCEAFGAQAAGVAIITAEGADGEPGGLTISSLSSVSAEPPIVSFSFKDRTGSAARIVDADSFLIHLIGAENVETAKLFAVSKADKFGDTSTWDRLPTGEPLLHGISRVLRVKPIGTLNAGPAVVFTAEVTDFIRHDANATPTVYHARRFHGLGDHSAL